MKRITLVCVLSGIIAGLIASALFYLVFPSAWLFLIIPAVMGFAVEKFGISDDLDLQDEYQYNKFARHCGLLCGGLCLTFICLCTLPILLVAPIELLASVGFDLGCVLSVFWAYRRGVKAVLNTAYKRVVEAE